MIAWLVVAALALQPSVRERMEEALRLAHAGETARARTIFETIVAELPKHGPARLQLGQLAIARGDWHEAVQHLEVAVVSNPQRLQLAWYLLGRARAALGDEPGAIEAFERALDIDPTFVAARLELAEVALDGNDLWTALAHYREAVRRHPDRPETLAALANVARRMEATELARCAADAALATEPDNGALHYLRAVIAEQAGNVDEALTFSRRALELGYENAALYVTLGNLYHEKMMLTESIAAFEKALELDPAAAESLASFALASLTTSDYQKLRPLLELHAVEHPDNVNTLYALGAMNLREGKLDKAEAAFTRLAKLVPRRAETHYNLAMTYLRQGREREGLEAMATFRELKAIEDEAWTRANEHEQLRHRLGELEASGQHDEIIELGMGLVDDGVATADDRLRVARALRHQGREAEAARLVAETLDADPYHRESLALAEALGDAAAGERLRLLDPDCRR